MDAGADRAPGPAEEHADVCRHGLPLTAELLLVAHDPRSGRARIDGQRPAATTWWLLESEGLARPEPRARRRRGFGRRLERR